VEQKDLGLMMSQNFYELNRMRKKTSLFLIIILKWFFFFRDTHGRRWDFDIMLDKKKLDRRRRRRRDGSIDLMADADDQIRELIDAMNEAANVLIF